MSIREFFVAGGIVMWPLLGFSILAIALIAERLKFWYKVNTRQQRVIREVLNTYRLNNVVSTIELLRKNADLPLARMFLAALQLEEPTPEEFRLALESEAQAEIPILKRFNTFFETIINLSPLLGLLGTVLGLITSLAALSFADIGSMKATGVTAGISEALVSTAAGLIVAIFTLMFANVFRGMYIRQIAMIQEYSGQLELLYRHYYERGQKGEQVYAPTR